MRYGDQMAMCLREREDLGLEGHEQVKTFGDGGERVCLNVD